ncbi:MFS transporter [Labedaea rhizosphaerae]|uniref:Putative MFS family arabinose efflux permease n=1 Tax=Labedaea rhizosphaerae TaxID=598644 RepID=A0A4R6SGK4_LABRH|nr:MFS transporter [Labedaea rhizosphaerae]TDQ00865.1 putative MFS family arabinose efflux permease [Labedaea rhizosphaerae]
MRSWIRVALALFGIGWGANQFAPLLLVYRDRLPDTVVTALFGAYAIGLIPALLLGATYSDRLGRQRVMRPVVVLSLLASAVLLIAGDDVWLLTAGRLLAGIASGAAFGPGTAWVKELSADAGPGAGARRAAIALSAGFGGGPLVAGIFAQWLPAPAVLPYAAHIALMLVVIPLVWRAPETAVRGDRPRAGLRDALRHPVFRRVVAPAAPLVFGTATVSFAVLPGLVPVHGIGIAAGGAIAGLTLGAGVAVQPVARRLHRHRTRVFGLGLAAAGFLLGALTIRLGAPIMLVPTAAVLGAGYGMLLVAGLGQVEALAAPDELAGATAVYYCLAYAGMVAPYVVTALHSVLPPALLLCIAAAIVALIIPVTRQRRAGAEV